MDFRHFTAGTDDAERRIDKVMRRFLSDSSLSSLYKSFRKGLIKVNGKKCDGTYKVKFGDDIQIASFLVENQENHLENPDHPALKPLDEKIIVFRNENILVINKTYDIVVQPSFSSQKGTSLCEMVSADYDFHHGSSQSLSFRTGPLHRLDRKTTGLIVFSQSIDGARKFSSLIQSHVVTKCYVALVMGKLTENQEWTDEIIKDEEKTKSQSSFHTVRITDGNDGKTAHTYVAPLAWGKIGSKDVTLAEFVIDTGRTHQIRSQSAFHNHPLVGDEAYGGKINSGLLEQDFYLHAYELRFPKENEIGAPEVLRAFISTKFKKMLNSALINWNGHLII